MSTAGTADSSGDGVIRYCGQVPINHLSPGSAVDVVLRWVEQNRGTHPTGRDVHLVNAWTVVLADEQAELSSLLPAASLNLPDGTPLVWNARLRGAAVPRERVRGPQYFLDVLDRGRPLGLRHFFLGSSESTLAKLVGETTRAFPGLTIVGTHSPPFRPLTEPELAEQDSVIAVARPDVVWVGLGTPKQDLEAARLASSLSVITVAVGAAFDFAAGTVPVAPVWMQQSGLEWLHRLTREPRRLWRRYLVGNAKFVRIALREQGLPGGIPGATEP